jgi:hypothetical protein
MYGIVEAWTTLLNENNPGQVRVDAPTLVVHGTNDLLPIEDVRHMHELLCTLGRQIELRVIDGGDHDASWVVAAADASSGSSNDSPANSPSSSARRPALLPSHPRPSRCRRRGRQGRRSSNTT